MYCNGRKKCHHFNQLRTAHVVRQISYNLLSFFTTNFQFIMYTTGKSSSKDSLRYDLIYAPILLQTIWCIEQTAKHYLRQGSAITT